MKSLLLCLFLSVWVLVEVLIMCCEGCLKQERQGLISVNSKLSYKEDDSSLDLTESPLYWVDNTTDCCQWKGVECNSTTGRIAKLKLQSIFGQLNYSDFLIFKDLKTLDLSNTLLINCTRTDQQGLYISHTNSIFITTITNVKNESIFTYYYICRVEKFGSS
jgi:hypothetical protein